MPRELEPRCDMHPAEGAGSILQGLEPGRHTLHRVYGWRAAGPGTPGGTYVALNSRRQSGSVSWSFVPRSEFLPSLPPKSHTLLSAAPLATVGGSSSSPQGPFPNGNSTLNGSSFSDGSSILGGSSILNRSSTSDKGSISDRSLTSGRSSTSG